MFVRSSASSHVKLIEQLWKNGRIKSEKVRDCLMAVDRAHFCSFAPYSDHPQSIGFNATISAPHMHAIVLELLKDHLYEGSSSLDVGSGSGYLTACMAFLTGSTGKTVGIEHIPELVEKSITNVRKTPLRKMFDSGRLKLLVGDGRQGHKNDAPYQAIHVGAAAETVPDSLIDQLALGGRLVVPVGAQGDTQVLTVIDKKADGSVVSRRQMGVVYVPLTSRSKQTSFF